MSADELSPINMPAVAWTSNAGSRESDGETRDKEKKVNAKLKTGKEIPPELDFEPVEHELDSIA
ncbi:MAG TPA: hypothetical protein VJO35_16245 [Terriglobales bacterium]|nr:hypothetical protein [Terriglobales bacterium]